jgi:hypothetical protein
MGNCSCHRIQKNTTNGTGQESLESLDPVSADELEHRLEHRGTECKDLQVTGPDLQQLRYGRFVFSSDQADAILALKTMLEDPQTVKRTSDNGKTTIKWLGGAEILSPHLAVSGDLMYHKFLLAHQHNEAKAAQYFITMVYDRRQLGLDSVLEELLLYWDDEFNMLDFRKIEGGALFDTWIAYQKHMPFSDALGVSKTHMEIKLFRPARWNLKQLMGEVQCDHIRRINMYKHEHFLLASDKYAHESGQLLRRCTLEDFTKFSFGPFHPW